MDREVSGFLHRVFYMMGMFKYCSNFTKLSLNLVKVKA